MPVYPQARNSRMRATMAANCRSPARQRSHIIPSPPANITPTHSTAPRTSNNAINRTACAFICFTFVTEPIAIDESVGMRAHQLCVELFVLPWVPLRYCVLCRFVATGEDFRSENAEGRFETHLSAIAYDLWMVDSLTCLSATSVQCLRSRRRNMVRATFVPGATQETGGRRGTCGSSGVAAEGHRLQNHR